jgi:hypothetical protein
MVDCSFRLGSDLALNHPRRRQRQPRLLWLDDGRSAAGESKGSEKGRREVMLQASRIGLKTSTCLSSSGRFRLRGITRQVENDDFPSLCLL